jgi:hypothetical protein
MDDLKVDEVDRVAAEIAELATGQGFTAAKARRQDALLGLGYRKRRPDPGEDATIDGIRLALRAGIDLLRRRAFKVGSPRRYFPGALVAEAALGIGGFRADSLMDRRNSAALTIDASGTTFAKYERVVFRELAGALVAHRLDPTTLSSELTMADSTVGYRPPDWTIVTQERMVYLDRRGAITDYWRRATIKAEIDGLRRVRFWVEYYSDMSPGVVRAVRALNASIARQEDRGGAHVTELLLDPPLDRGETRRLGLDFALHTEVRCVPRIRSTAVSEVAEAKMALQFDVAYRPGAVWYWNNVGIGDEFDPDPARVLAVSRNGYVEYTFGDVRAGASYGLAWEWP